MALERAAVSRRMKDYPAVCRLMKTAFPKNERTPMWVLRLFASRKGFAFHAFYEDGRFCGLLYTAETEAYVFVLYLAVDDQFRSKGCGSGMLEWLKNHSGSKIIALHVEAENPSAPNAGQRKKRIAFYQRNGVADTGCVLVDGGERFSVLSSDCGRFDPREYEEVLKRLSFGLYRKKITRT